MSRSRARATSSPYLSVTNWMLESDGRAWAQSISSLSVPSTAAVGIFGCGGNVLGAFGPGMLGWMNGRFGMRWSMASLAAFALAGVAVILFARGFYLKNGKVQLPLYMAHLIGL